MVQKPFAGENCCYVKSVQAELQAHNLFFIGALDRLNDFLLICNIKIQVKAQ